MFFSSPNVNLKSEIDKLDSRLQAEELRNEVLKQKLNDYEIQIELSNSKINVNLSELKNFFVLIVKKKALNNQIELKESEFKAFKLKIDQIESARDTTIKKLTQKNNV